jgi:hypothetical protein
MLYCVQANVCRSFEGWKHYHGVPTFYLNSRVQGIMSGEHAEQIARDIINPLKDDALWVQVTVTACPEPTTDTAE